MNKTRDKNKNSVSEKYISAGRGFGIKFVPGVLLVLFCFLFLFLGACYLGEPIVFTDSTGQTSAEQTSAQQTEQTVFTAGETAYISGVGVTMVALKESLGNEYWNPQVGFVYLICEFEIENNSETQISVSSILSFEAIVDGKKKNLSLIAGVTHDVVTADGTIEPGETLHGSVGYEVPENWKEAKIRFSPDMMNKNSVFFRADKTHLVSR